MKPFFNTNSLKVFTLFLALCSFSNLNAQTILDFESGGITTTFSVFGGTVSSNNVADPINPSNTALEIDRPATAQCFAGAESPFSPTLTVPVDFTGGPSQVCFDYYEPNTTGGFKLKFEINSVGPNTWEYDWVTSFGWNNYCVNASALSSDGNGSMAQGNSYGKIAVFPNFTCVAGSPSYPDVISYFDNLIISPITCPLTISQGTATCTTNTAGTDLYDASFTFSQPSAPGAGTYTTTPVSGGTVSGDDPNTMVSGTITISGVTEGTNAELNITDNANCNETSIVASPNCLPPYDITFRVDMCAEINSGNFDETTQGVYVAGGPIYPNCGNVMSDVNNDGVYELTRTYDDATTFNYKYMIADITFANTANCTGVANSGSTFEDGLPAPCGDPNNFDDRIYTVNGMNDILPIVCYSSCDACTTCVAGAGCMDSNSANYDPAATVDDGSCLYDVIFTVDMNCPDHIAPPTNPITTVSIVGPFNGWSPGTDLTNLGGNIWSITLQLPIDAAGFEYKYMVNSWEAQENLLDNGNAGEPCVGVNDGTNANRLIFITGASNQDDIYGNCTACPDPCPPSLTLNAPEAGVADYESSGNISSISVIGSGAMIDYDSATDIDLNPDFEVVLGAVFCAFIDGCGGAAVDNDDTSNLQQKENNMEDDKKLESSKE